MLMLFVLILPLIGVFATATNIFGDSKLIVKSIGLLTSIISLVTLLIVFMLFDYSNAQYQFVQNYYGLSSYNIFFGIDGLSLYFVLLTAIIAPIAILSNWISIQNDEKWYIIIMLLLEVLLLAVFLGLDILLFYVSFESILPPLFLLIGIFGANNRVRASFYLFLYTLLGSLFLLLSILLMNTTSGTTDYYVLFKMNFKFIAQLFLFYGIFIAFAVKTPTIFLNTWLLKAHVESPLGGSIILAGIVLKLSLYGIFRLILPELPKASINYTFIIFFIGLISILYASFSTLRTVDIKELIAYSSVSHAAVYLIGVFSNTLQGIAGGILLGLGHGFVSSGLFICAGGALYDRSSTRLITYYRGVTQLMPLFSILFFILCLSNAGTPLSLNFVGEFLSLYGTFERLPTLGALSSTSIILSAAYTIYMFNRISFGGTFSRYFIVAIPDLNKREFTMLLTLIVFTVVLGIYPAVIIDGFNFSISSLIYSFDGTNLYSEGYVIMNSTAGNSDLYEDILTKSYTFFFYISILCFSIGLVWILLTYNIKCILLYVKGMLLQPNSMLLIILYGIILRLLLYNISDDMYVLFVSYLDQKIQYGNALLSSPLDGDVPVGENPSSEGPSGNNPNSDDSVPNDDDDDKNKKETNNNSSEYSKEATDTKDLNDQNSEDPGEGPSNSNQSTEEVNQEGLEAEARRMQRIGECEHRTFEKTFLHFGPDMAGKVKCDFGDGNHFIDDDAWLCKGCMGITCMRCDQEQEQIDAFGNRSDEDSAAGNSDEGEPWSKEGEKRVLRELKIIGSDSDSD